MCFFIHEILELLLFPSKGLLKVFIDTSTYHFSTTVCTEKGQHVQLTK